MMAHPEGTLTLEFLTTFLPEFLIEKYARALGVVERDRKVDPVLLVWTLILGFPAGAKRTLASLRRRFQQAAGLTVARSSFHARLTRPLAELLKKLVDWRLSMGRDGRESDGGLAGFKELLALDSTVVQLHKMLASRWHSTDPDGAAAKLHMVTNVVSGSPNRVQLTGQRTSDLGPWKTIGSWVTDCLLLMDLGYYEFHLFWRIDQKGGSYLSRAKSNANPRIVGSNQTVRGNAIDLVGHTLQDVLGRLQRRFIDVDVEVPVTLRAWGGTRSTRQMRMRLVGVRNDQTGHYHLYFTNIDADTLTPAQIAQTYRLRWQVELLFTRLKTTMRLNQLPSSKPEVVEALIYAAILSVLMSNAFLQILRQLEPDRVFPAQRMDAVFRDVATALLMRIASHRRDEAFDLFAFMLAEAADPNRDRSRSHDILGAIPLDDALDYGVFQEVTA
jgi:IS4 transposase